MKRAVFFVGLLFLLGPSPWAGDALWLAPGLAIERLPRVYRPSADDWGERVELVGCRRHLWLVAAKQIWRLDQREPLLPAPVPLSAFTCTPAGTLVAAAEGRFGPINGRLFAPMLPLPSPRARLAAAPPDALVIYEQQVPARIFHFDGERVQLVTTLAEPITALTVVGNAYLVATPSGLYKIHGDKPLQLVFPWPAEEQPIVGLAVHPRTAEIIVASEDEIFLLDAGRMEQIAYGIGGAVVVDEDAIFVADPKRKEIVRLYRRR
ncbi:MAG: hypothetical protein N2441_07990 [Rhodocyclaceae bacterium]|nr:hypothetical protein [Rhodocyclaceae bacterium]